MSKLTELERLADAFYRGEKGSWNTLLEFLVKNPKMLKQMVALIRRQHEALKWRPDQFDEANDVIEAFEAFERGEP